MWFPCTASWTNAPHEPMLLIMERMHENLFRAYGSDPAPSPRQRVEWLLQAGRGISFLHAQSPPILHRDIKPANMLLTSPATGRRLKMSDFGLSKSLADITASLATRSTMPAAGGGSAAAAEVGTPHSLTPSPTVLKCFTKNLFCFHVQLFVTPSLLPAVPLH